MHLPATDLRLHSLITADGELHLSLARVPVPSPSADEVVVRVEATPINPSDVGLMLGPADISRGRLVGEGEDIRFVAPVSTQAAQMLAARVGQALPAGNEGAGVVVAAGTSREAQSLLGKVVALATGAMFAQYRVAKARDLLVMPDGTTPMQAASAIINPITALCMVETMRREGHTALAHTAAASNLGQMLNKICVKEGIGLVNIVRGAAQAQVLKSAGARYVVESPSPTFIEELSAAVEATDATLAFDAVGGGPLAAQILTAMELAQNKKSNAPYSRYGSTVHKQVYIYGGLDAGPTELRRAFGMAWGVGGWLVGSALAKMGAEAEARLRQRVIEELTTTFTSQYTRTISLHEALQPQIVSVYSKRATGEKFLINPHD